MIILKAGLKTMWLARMGLFSVHARLTLTFGEEVKASDLKTTLIRLPDRKRCAARM